jgi:hypothetical protein
MTSQPDLIKIHKPAHEHECYSCSDGLRETNNDPLAAVDHSTIVARIEIGVTCGNVIWHSDKNANHYE